MTLAVTHVVLSAAIFCLIAWVAVITPPSYDEITYYLPTVEVFAEEFPRMPLYNYGGIPLAAPPGWLIVQATVGFVTGFRGHALIIALRILNVLTAGFVWWFFNRRPQRCIDSDTGGLVDFAVLFGSYMLLDPIRIKPVFPAMLLSLPAIALLRELQSLKAVAPSALRATWIGVCSALGVWVNQFTVMVAAIAVASMVDTRRHDGLFVRHRHLCLNAIPIGAAVGVVGLLAMWGTLTPPGVSGYRLATASLPCRILCPLISLGVYAAPFSALLFRRKRGLLIAGGCLLVGVASTHWRIFHAPTDSEHLLYLGVTNSTVARLTQGNAFAAYVFQTFHVGLGCSVIAGLALDGDPRVRTAGLSLLALLGVMLAEPIPFERYYVFAYTL